MLGLSLLLRILWYAINVFFFVSLTAAVCVCLSLCFLSSLGVILGAQLTCGRLHHVYRLSAQVHRLSAVVAIGPANEKFSLQFLLEQSDTKIEMSIHGLGGEITNDLPSRWRSLRCSWQLWIRLPRTGASPGLSSTKRTAARRQVESASSAYTRADRRLGVWRQEHEPKGLHPPPVCTAILLCGWHPSVLSAGTFLPFFAFSCLILSFFFSFYFSVRRSFCCEHIDPGFVPGYL